MPRRSLHVSLATLISLACSGHAAALEAPAEPSEGPERLAASDPGSPGPGGRAALTTGAPAAPESPGDRAPTSLREAQSADEDALPCRPTIACTADIVSAGKLEVEAGYAGRGHGSGFQSSTPVILKLSVTDAWQLQVGTNGFVHEQATAAYVDDVVVAVKYRLTEQDGSRPAMAISVGLGIPTPGAQLGYQPGYDANVTAYASKDLGPVHADLNLAATLMDVASARIVQPLAALSLSTEVAGRRLIPMIEAYWFGQAGSLAPSDHGLLMAVGVAATRGVIFDVGGDYGMGGQDRRFTLFVGVTALTSRLWEPAMR